MNELCEQIEDFIDDQLDSSDAEAFEVHLEGCLACQKILRETKSLERELVEAWSSVSAPSSILETASDSNPSDAVGLSGRKGESSDFRESRKAAGWKHVFAVAASLTVLAALILFLRFNGTNENDQHATSQNSPVKDSWDQAGSTNGGDSAVAAEPPSFALKVTSALEPTEVSPAILLAKTEDEFTIIEVYPIYEPTNKSFQQ